MTAPQDFDPPQGIALELAPGLRRIVAPNPSPMTYKGTNTYLLGTTELAVIDPGPDHKGHLAAIQNAVRPGQRITHIIVTHSHLDHSPLARPLAQATGAPVLGFGTAAAGRSRIMQELAESGLMGGGEGVDTLFVPDIVVMDKHTIQAEGWSLEVLHTPGHMGNHICLAWQNACFTADHVMGWSTSLVSPPDGDLSDFMASCARLRERNWQRLFPGHGDVIDTPAARLDWLVQHRQNREAAVLGALRAGPASARTIATSVYTDIARPLLPAAERNVLAHLIDLYGKSRVIPQGDLTAQAEFELVPQGPQ